MSRSLVLWDTKVGDVPVIINGPTPSGQTPSIASANAGGSSSSFNGSGDISLQVASAGINPGATGADNVLAAFSLPANFFDIAGRGVEVTAEGSFAATGNNKDVKIIFNPATAVVGSTVGAGGTTVADTGTSTGNNVGWSIQANVYKYGNPGSNTQLGLHSQAQVGATVSTLLKPSLITATESGPILIAVTGNATTVATDIVFNFLQVFAMN
jgi:hypothetical protein